MPRSHKKQENCCPICHKVLSAEQKKQACMPFCSERCQKVDLNQWLGESYKIVEEENDLSREKQ